MLLIFNYIDMPMTFCTQNILPAVEYAEDAHQGPTTKRLCEVYNLYYFISSFKNNYYF